MAAGKIVYDHLSRLCAAAGGAISGEHGIGKTKRPMLAETTSPQALETMRAIKRALDPAGILCRGNILDAGAKVDDRSGR